MTGDALALLLVFGGLGLIVSPGDWPVPLVVAAFVLCLVGAIYFGAGLLRGKK